MIISFGVQLPNWVIVNRLDLHAFCYFVCNLFIRFFLHGVYVRVKNLFLSIPRPFICYFIFEMAVREH